jgi:hypothetical protein
MSSIHRRALSATAACALAASAGLACAGTATAAAVTVTQNWTCTNAEGATALTQPFTITMPGSIGEGGTIAAGALSVDPGPQTPAVTSPVALTSVITPSLTLGISGPGIAAGTTITVPAAAQPSQTTAAGVSPTVLAYTNSAAIQLPAGATAGTDTLTMDTYDSSDATTAYGTQEDTCVITPGDAAQTVGTIAVTAPAPTASVSPGALQAGNSVTVTGANFTPGETVTIKGYDGATASTDPAVTTTAGAAGTISASYTVNDAATTSLQVTAADTATPISLALTVTAAPTGPAAGQEGVGGTVNAGPLGVLVPADVSLAFPAIQLNGQPHTVTTQFTPVEVQDFRGGTLGWSLTAQMAAPLAGSTGGSLPEADLAVVGSGVVQTPGSQTPPSTPTAGTGGALNAAVTLATQAASTNNTVTGGDFTVGGELSLSTPAYLLAGTYTGDITFTLS